MSNQRIKTNLWPAFFCGLLLFSGCVSAEPPAACAPDKVCVFPHDTFEACVAAGNKVFKTSPARCIDAAGKTYYQIPPAVLDPRAIANTKPFCKNTCGNGKCEEIACMAQGCPCPESHHSCPQDCP